MTATTVQLHVAAPRTAPRGAAALAHVFAAVLTGAERGVSALGRVFRREPSPYESVQAVLEMARDYERSQPGFAADLRAAACRFDGDFDR
ncbi:hypothetical protein [Caldimonas brevitalea]|uniref:Uncharacterized protein n=1 Tax=Caldimonas brevitalea TaxID=413882 RepID=A0A0G3BVV2_9BURK|nr:hypothetical protein [Caldimonas brevitalea]AKJ32158.1 hypothetical protein AAW51_5467 [Caldimonas brevitalea]